MGRRRVRRLYEELKRAPTASNAIHGDGKSTDPTCWEVRVGSMNVGSAMSELGPVIPLPLR